MVERADGWTTVLRLQVRKGKFVPTHSIGPSASQNRGVRGAGVPGSDWAVYRSVGVHVDTGSDHFCGH